MNLTETQRWGLGIVILLLGQICGTVWYASSLAAQVDQNTREIAALKTNAVAFITRSQLEDVLGGRDQRLTNIEAGVTRLEAKFDRTFGK